MPPASVCVWEETFYVDPCIWLKGVGWGMGMRIGRCALLQAPKMYDWRTADTILGVLYTNGDEGRQGPILSTTNNVSVPKITSLLPDLNERYTSCSAALLPTCHAPPAEHPADVGLPPDRLAALLCTGKKVGAGANNGCYISEKGLMQRSPPSPVTMRITVPPFCRAAQLCATDPPGGPCAPATHFSSFCQV